MKFVSVQIQGTCFHSTHLAELLSNCILEGSGPFYKSCIKAVNGCKFCSIYLMSNSNKWSKKGKIFISNSINKEAEIFQFFKAHVTCNMALGLRTFCEVFFVMAYLWLSKGQRHFWGALCRKGRKDKTGEMQQNSQFSLLLAQF